MTGGLLQVVAKGHQDTYLIGNTSLFRTVYKRHTNFAVEHSEQYIIGNPNFGQKIQIVLTSNSKKGDLISNCCLQVTLPDVYYTTSAAWVNDIGNMLIKEISVEIGDTIIDKQYGEWLSIWHALTIPMEKRNGYLNMIGNTSDLVGTSLDMITDVNPIPSKELYIPLNFWFQKNLGLALPLIALQYNDVKFKITFRTAQELLRGDVLNVGQLQFKKVGFFIDHVFLSKEEREIFAKSNTKYLIEQIQVHEESITGKNHMVSIPFNQPLKELIVVIKDNSYLSGTAITKNYINFADINGNNPIETMYIKANNVDRITERSGTYFNKWHPFYHHSNVPNVGINIYSFAQFPEQHRPSGSFNGSKLDSMTLVFTLNDVVASRSNTITVYATNYNVLNIQRGMGTLEFKV
jgi:hypothetical protein